MVKGLRPSRRVGLTGKQSQRQIESRYFRRLQKSAQPIVPGHQLELLLPRLELFQLTNRQVHPRLERLAPRHERSGPLDRKVMPGMASRRAPNEIFLENCRPREQRKEPEPPARRVAEIARFCRKRGIASID